MYNQVRHNVAICPWPRQDPDLFSNTVRYGCTIPGTDNSQADTNANQAGLWALSAINHIIGNRFANSFNGKCNDLEYSPRAY